MYCPPDPIARADNKNPTLVPYQITLFIYIDLTSPQPFHKNWLQWVYCEMLDLNCYHNIGSDISRPRCKYQNLSVLQSVIFSYSTLAISFFRSSKVSTFNLFSSWQFIVHQWRKVFNGMCVLLQNTLYSDCFVDPLKPKP